MVRGLQIALAAGLVALAGCRSAPTAPPDRRNLEARNLRDFENAWNRDFTRLDVERLVSRYAEDATLVLPTTSPATGSEAIRLAWKAAVQDGNFSMKMDSQRIEVARSSDLAFSQGNYTATTTDPVTAKEIHENGIYVIVYRKTGTVWKAVVDTRYRVSSVSQDR